MQMEHSSQSVKARQRRPVVVYLMQNLRLRGRPPPIIFTRIVRPYNFVGVRIFCCEGSLISVVLFLFYRIACIAV